MTLVTVTEERQLIVSILSKLGAPDKEAEMQADLLVEADLRGHPSHGLQRLPVIVQRIRNGLTVPGEMPRATWASTAFVHMDGCRGFGPVVASRAIELISARAREAGLAVAAVANNNHLGILAPYVECIAERGQIGLAMTTSEALVHPFGGRRAMIGTNPLAVALPADPQPFVFDMATGEVSMGRILSHMHRGEQIPSGWALDEKGSPTTDATAASRGAISPFGGPKGYGLGLAIELLVAALTGTAVGRTVRGTLDATEICNKGDLFLCADPEALGLEDIRSMATAYLGEIRNESGRPGEIITVPGDRSKCLRAHRLVNGVPIVLSVWERVEEMRREILQVA